MSATGRCLTKRHPYDAYSTPTWCTEAIINQIVIPPRSSAIEPCAGTGAIVDLLKWHFDEELIETCEIKEGRDFLILPCVSHFDFCITNPPFSLAQEFIEHSLEIANCVIMLLRLNFLASAKRKEFWQKHPPTAIHVLTKRPSFTGKGTDATDYAWFVWDSTGRQKVGWHWL